jgi:hypothetical protein
LKTQGWRAVHATLALVIGAALLYGCAEGHAALTNAAAVVLGEVEEGQVLTLVFDHDPGDVLAVGGEIVGGAGATRSLRVDAALVELSWDDAGAATLQFSEFKLDSSGPGNPNNSPYGTFNESGFQLGSAAPEDGAEVDADAFERIELQFNGTVASATLQVVVVDDAGDEIRGVHWDKELDQYTVRLKPDGGIESGWAVNVAGVVTTSLTPPADKPDTVHLDYTFRMLP